jgi:hypothetical protein
MKRHFQVSAPDISMKQVECSGCSGDALTLALQGMNIDCWKVSRRSTDGNEWFFDVAISGICREFKVKML